jgi:tetratricopeptide (TPR) repeat protein
MSRPRLIALLLALATLLVFLPAGGFAFLNYDDTDYVTNNPVVRQGLNWNGVVWAFTGFHASNWHPLTWLSHMIDCALFGLNPGAQHFVNVLFHAANGALLFGLLWRITQRLWPSALVAALFTWHPLRVESVAWIAERKDVLSTFFALLALLAYARYAKESGRRDGKSRAIYATSLGMFGLGLMAKPTLVTLPFVLLLLDYWPLERFGSPHSRGRLVMEKIPFFLLSLGSCIVTYNAQRAGEAVVSLDRIPLTLRLENAPVAVAGYVREIFWPADLCVIYPMPREIPPISLVLCGLTIALIFAAAWHWRKSNPYVITGWLWFLGTLVPMIGLVQVGGQSMADRYTYIPGIGFTIAVVFLAGQLADRLKASSIFRFGGAGVVLLACILVTEHQLQFWRDSETLFRRALAVTTQNSIAFINLGVALEEQGRLEEALDNYQRAEKTGVRRRELYYNLGHVLSRLGRHPESLSIYQEAIRWRPADAAMHEAAGAELVDLGRFDKAQAEFSQAETLNPNDGTPHVEAAGAWFKEGRDSQGLDELRAALRLEPDNFETLATTARYLAANENESARDGKRALELALAADNLSGHTQPLVLDILGMAYAEMRDFTNAAASAQNALDLAGAAELSSTNEIKQRLDLYRQNQPWRESFWADLTHAKDAKDAK